MLQPFITPPYSPDLNQPDYFLFPKLKMKYTRLLFADVAEIQKAANDELKKVQNEEISANSQNPVYRVSQEKCARLRESFPYVKVY
jgi:hypothetical protein